MARIDRDRMVKVKAIHAHLLHTDIHTHLPTLAGGAVEECRGGHDDRQHRGDDEEQGRGGDDRPEAHSGQAGRETIERVASLPRPTCVSIDRGSRCGGCLSVLMHVWRHVYVLVRQYPGCCVSDAAMPPEPTDGGGWPAAGSQNQATGRHDHDALWLVLWWVYQSNSIGIRALKLGCIAAWTRTR